MSDQRTAILNRVRGALALLPDRAALPDYAADIATVQSLLAGRNLVDVFAKQIVAAVGEIYFDTDTLCRSLINRGCRHGYCDPQLLPVITPALASSGLEVSSELRRSEIDTYGFGITRARGGIAETGTIILNDATSSSRLGALAPWIHVAVLKRGEILPDIASALADLGNDPNVVWCTGASSTGDVESILIRGVHGPGVQAAFIID